MIEKEKILRILEIIKDTSMKAIDNPSLAPFFIEAGKSQALSIINLHPDPGFKPGGITVELNTNKKVDIEVLNSIIHDNVVKKFTEE